MSFQQLKLDKSVDQARDIFDKYIYRTTDTIATVSADGYFTKSRFLQSEPDEWQGSILEVICSDGFRILTISDDGLSASLSVVSLNNQIIVTEASQLAGELSSTIEYFLDGVIDMAGQPIEIPAGGLHIAGYDFDISKLISSEAAYTMFTSPIGGSGNYLGINYAVEVTGAGSKVYDIVDSDGTHAIEIANVNYNNCVSLGTIDGYRQGLEFDTGRFGGKPSLELDGTWAGGYRATTSIIRNIDNTMAPAIFKAGATFTMASRFLTDINADLGTLAPLIDFAPANFPNPSTLQIVAAIITRNGVSDPTDSTISPNITAANLSSSFRNNEGFDNTFVGGQLDITAEITTTISIINTPVNLAGTFTASDLQHMDSPSNGQIRNLGNTPRNYKLNGDLVLDSNPNNVLALILTKWDDSASSFSDIYTQRRQVNSLAGGRDVAFFNPIKNFTLDQNDYVFLRVENQSGTANITAELDSFITIERR